MVWGVMLRISTAEFVFSLLNVIIPLLECEEFYFEENKEYKE